MWELHRDNMPLEVFTPDEVAKNEPFWKQGALIVGQSLMFWAPYFHHEGPRSGTLPYSQRAALMLARDTFLVRWYSENPYAKIQWLIQMDHIYIKLYEIIIIHKHGYPHYIECSV